MGLINLTVRVEATQKAEADIACEYLGRNLSIVVRQAIADTIREYHMQLAKDTGYARQAMESEEMQRAYHLIRDFIQAADLHGGALSIVDGKLALNGKFVPND